MTDLLSDRGVVALVSVVSLLAVAVPLYRGLRICLRARGATRWLKASALEGGARVAVGDSLALLMLRVLTRSLADDGDEAVPQDFVLDASKQYVMNEYGANYANVISMYANLLPPIGFIGTTSGMLILLMSMHLSDASLELGALALALTSSIFALIGFALLESLKIRLYGRLMRCLAEVTEFHLRALEKKRV
jgi:hypothetical protein